MEAFEYKTYIRYQDINANNSLSDKGILNLLSEAGGVHSNKVRVWTQPIRRKRFYLDAFVLENKGYKKTKMAYRSNS